MGGQGVDGAEDGDIAGAGSGSAAGDAAAFRAAAGAMLEALDGQRSTQCPACRGAALQRWGKGRSAVQRWRCRDCERSFSTTTGTLLAGLHAPGKLRLVLLDMLSDAPASCRGLAAKLAVSATTAWAWRQRVNRAFQLIAADRPVNSSPEEPGPVADTGEIAVVRESRKASREWVDHARDPAGHPAPDRLRWLDYREQRLPLPQPMTPYLLPVRLFRGRLGTCGAALLTGQPAGAFVTAEAGAEAPMDLANAPLPLLSAAPQAHGEPTADPAQPASMPTLRERFETFLRPLCGPARQHLDGYVAWFVAREASAVEVCRTTLAAWAWRALAKPRPTRFRTWAAAGTAGTAGT